MAGGDAMAKHASKFEMVDDLMKCKSEDFKKHGLGVKEVRPRATLHRPRERSAANSREEAMICISTVGRSRAVAQELASTRRALPPAPGVAAPLPVDDGWGICGRCSARRC